MKAQHERSGLPSAEQPVPEPPAAPGRPQHVGPIEPAEDRVDQLRAPQAKASVCGRKAAAVQREGFVRHLAATLESGEGRPCSRTRGETGHDDERKSD